jgi:hypothetical protein
MDRGVEPVNGCQHPSPFSLANVVFDPGPFVMDYNDVEGQD